jgi:hypothetical protein
MVVTAYGVTLAWALAGDVFSDGDVLRAVREWQTLIAGLATVGALIYAGRQLQMDRMRDRRAYLQQHTPEWEALLALEADLDAFKKRRSPVLGALLKRRSGCCTVDLNAARWQRLNDLCVPAIDAPIRECIQATNGYDQFVRLVDSGTNPELADFEVSLIQGHLARCIDTDAALRTAIDRRKRSIFDLAPPER